MVLHKASSSGIAGHPTQGRAGERADRIEANVAPELQPNFQRMLSRTGASKPAAVNAFASPCTRAERVPSGSPMMKRLNW